MRVSPHSNALRKIIAAHKRLAALSRQRELEQLFDIDDYAERITKQMHSIRCTAPSRDAAIGVGSVGKSAADATQSGEAL